MKIFKNAVVPPHELSLETSTVLEETVELLLADIQVINSWICSNTSTVFLYLCCSWNKKRPAVLLKVRGQTKKSCFYSQLLRLRLKMSKNIKKQNDPVCSLWPESLLRYSICFYIRGQYTPVHSLIWCNEFNVKLDIYSKPDSKETQLKPFWRFLRSEEPQKKDWIQVRALQWGQVIKLSRGII